MTADAKILRRTYAILALTALSLLGQNGFAQTPSPDFHIYLAFGQSNMEGNGAVPAAEKTGVNARFQLMAGVNCPALNRTKGTWSTAVPPLCRCASRFFPRNACSRLTRISNSR